MAFENDSLLTVNEVGALLRVSRVTVYRLMERGELASVKVGESRRFRRRDIEAYIDRCTEVAPNPERAA